MKKDGNPISIGKAAKKYGIPKNTLSRYAIEGKVLTLTMPGVRGQARMLDELSVYKVAQGRMEKVDKGKREHTVVYRRGEGVGLDAMDVAREYMRHCKNVGYGERTYNDTERVVMGFAQRYDDLPFRGSEVQEFVSRMEVTQHTKKLYFGYIRTFYNWVERVYDIPTPIKRGMAPRAKKQLPRALDKTEVSRLLAVVEDRQDKVMVNTFLATAIRRGELCSLDKADVYPDYIHIKAEEGNKTGEGNVPIAMWLYEQLMGLSNRDGYLFAGQDGERITVDAVSHRVIRYMKSAGIEGSRRGPHTLRHTAACNLLEATGDLDFVRQILRHTDLNMTLIYAQLRPTSVQAKYQHLMRDVMNANRGSFEFSKV